MPNRIERKYTKFVSTTKGLLQELHEDFWTYSSYSHHMDGRVIGMSKIEEIFEMGIRQAGYGSRCHKHFDVSLLKDLFTRIRGKFITWCDGKFVFWDDINALFKAAFVQAQKLTPSSINVNTPVKRVFGFLSDSLPIYAQEEKNDPEANLEHLEIDPVYVPVLLGCAKQSIKVLSCVLDNDEVVFVEKMTLPEVRNVFYQQSTVAFQDHFFLVTYNVFDRDAETKEVRVLKAFSAQAQAEAFAYEVNYQIKQQHETIEKFLPKAEA